MLTDIIQGPANSIHSPQGLLERISELEEEVSNLRRLHLTIERNNGLFEALLAASQDGIALSRLDGTIIRIVKPVLGHVPANVAGVSIYDLVHPDDRATLREAYLRIIAGTERSIFHEVRMLLPDGTCVTVQDTMTDMLDNPAVHAVVHNYRNVTQLRAAEFARAELEAVIRHTPFAVFSKSTTGEILSWNDGAKAMFGYEREEILGRHIWTLVPFELREEEQLRRASVIEQRTTLSNISTVRVGADGTLIPVELVLAPLIASGLVHGVVHMSYRCAPE